MGGGDTLTPETLRDTDRRTEVLCPGYRSEGRDESRLGVVTGRLLARRHRPYRPTTLAPVTDTDPDLRRSPV